MTQQQLTRTQPVSGPARRSGASRALSVVLALVLLASLLGTVVFAVLMVLGQAPWFAPLSSAAAALGTVIAMRQVVLARRRQARTRHDRNRAEAERHRSELSRPVNQLSTVAQEPVIAPVLEDAVAKSTPSARARMEQVLGGRETRTAPSRLGAAARSTVFDVESVSPSRDSQHGAPATVEARPGQSGNDGKTSGLPARAAHALEAGRVAQDAVAAAPATPWEPTKVPAPSYVSAPKADRPPPAPLNLPSAPTVKDLPELPEKEQEPLRAVEGEAAPEHHHPAPIVNLDEVLRRRRA